MPLSLKVGYIKSVEILGCTEIIAAQKIEHYEIASYGGLVALALTLGKGRAASLLDKTLQEEYDTDELLTDIAEAHINFDAEEEGEKREHSVEETSSSSF